MIGINTVRFSAAVFWRKLLPDSTFFSVDRILGNRPFINPQPTDHSDHFLTVIVDKMLRPWHLYLYRTGWGKHSGKWSRRLLAVPIIHKYNYLNFDLRSVLHAVISQKCKLVFKWKEMNRSLLFLLLNWHGWQYWSLHMQTRRKHDNHMLPVKIRCECKSSKRCGKKDERKTNRTTTHKWTSKTCRSLSEVLLKFLSDL